LKFHDTTVNLPDSKIKLGRDLGAEIDIDPEMARKMMYGRSEVMYCTSVRSLTPVEIQSLSDTRSRLAFEEAFEKKL
jgi:hypothetical protein